MDPTDLMELVYADGKKFQPELPSGKPRCRGRAKSREGAQCGDAAIPGATVCRVHGGSAPQVLRKANLRMAELIMPAIGTLAREMAQGDRSSDRIKAANSILDRAGVVRNTEITIEVAEQFILEQALAVVAERPNPEQEPDAG